MCNTGKTRFQSCILHIKRKDKDEEGKHVKGRQVSTILVDKTTGPISKPENRLTTYLCLSTIIVSLQIIANKYKRIGTDSRWHPLGPGNRQTTHVDCRSDSDHDEWTTVPSGGVGQWQSGRTSRGGCQEQTFLCQNHEVTVTFGKPNVLSDKVKTRRKKQLVLSNHKTTERHEGSRKDWREEWPRYRQEVPRWETFCHRIPKTRTDVVVDTSTNRKRVQQLSTKKSLSLPARPVW